MNKNFANKSSSNLLQRPNKSHKKFHTNKSKENKNRIPPKNKLRNINKLETLNNSTNSNIKAKSHKKNNSNKEKYKSNINTAKINIVPTSNRNNNILLNSEKRLNTITTSNAQQLRIKKEQNKENISDNILPKNNVPPISNTVVYHTNKNNIRINPIMKSNNNSRNITQFNNKFHPDINNPNFLCNKKPKFLAKTELKKISYKLNIKEGEIAIQNFENLKYVPVTDTNALFDAWQNCSMIYKIFEEKMMKKNNFEINKTTLELITKNAEASEQLHEQKFWILYIEYLSNNNLLINEKQFLSVINEAFSYMTYSNCTQLRIYYLQKIKKYSPVYLKDGTFDDCDETYINKLNQSTINFIKNQKGAIPSNIKLKSANKNKIFKLENNLENKENMRDNKINCMINNM